MQIIWKRLNIWVYRYLARWAENARAKASPLLLASSVPPSLATAWHIFTSWKQTKYLARIHAYQYHYKIPVFTSFLQSPWNPNWELGKNKVIWCNQLQKSISLISSYIHTAEVEPFSIFRNKKKKKKMMGKNLFGNKFSLAVFKNISWKWIIFKKKTKILSIMFSKDVSTLTFKNDAKKEHIFVFWKQECF